MLLPLLQNLGNLGLTTRHQAEIDAASRVPFWILEIDQPRCSLTYSVGACTAVDQGEGNRCWYSYHTCQDRANISLTATRTWRFCTAPIPSSVATSYGSQLWPILETFTQAAQNVSTAGSFTQSEQVTFRLEDFGIGPVYDAPMKLPIWDLDKTA